MTILIVYLYLDNFPSWLGSLARNKCRTPYTPVSNLRSIKRKTCKCIDKHQVFERNVEITSSDLADRTCVDGCRRSYCFSGEKFNGKNSNEKEKNIYRLRML